jgi:hypothetical protein
MVNVEREYMGGGKAKLQTYLIIGLVLVGALVVGNLAFNNPDAAKNGFDKFLGLPGWAFPPILLVVGLLVFVMGLKLETDWPEALGALLVAAGVGLGEAKIGWDKFDVGGLVILPYVIPLAVFMILLFYGMMKSR